MRPRAETRGEVTKPTRVRVRVKRKVIEYAAYDNATTLSVDGYLCLKRTSKAQLWLTQSLGFAPVHSARFAMIPSGHHVSAETEATETLVVLELQ